MRACPANLSLRRLVLTTAVLAGATVLVGAACSLVGRFPPAELTGHIWRMRLLRLATAATVGAALAGSGMALQALLRNPLAEPYILGISSGAGVGVLMGMALARLAALPPWATTPVLALIGALVTAALVYAIAQRHGRLEPFVLLLTGVIVNAFNGAVMLTIWLFFDPYVIADFHRWAMGELTDTTATPLLTVGAVVVVGAWGMLFVRGAAFNALGLGDEVARSSGVSVARLRVETFVIVGLMAAAAVALAGPIGFLGLIVPHVCRVIVGPDHRRLVIVSGFAGAMFLMLADTLCRTVGAWLEVGNIPVGILTAMCGGPFFIVLLRRRFGKAEA